MDYNYMLDVIEIAIGIYVIYLAWQMKSTGKLKHNGLISKSVDLNRANDPAGYIKATFIPDVISGVVLIICGVISRMSEGSSYYGVVQNVCMVVTVVILFVFGFIIMKSQRKYLEGK